jgi:2-polyprenyl-3-methyl-5-hydroxy-6-metoxy-1,4-benzoquinol methylase
VQPSVNWNLLAWVHRDSQFVDASADSRGVVLMNAAVLEHRITAAQASGGVSDASIYRMVIRNIQQNDLRGSLLDFGAGKGVLTSLLLETQRFSRIAAADLQENPGELGSNVEWIAADLNDCIPCASESFDVIVAAEIIEHLENPRIVARELFRLLRPGGTLLLTTPNNESWRSLISLAIRGHYIAFNDGSYPAHITALLRTDIVRVVTEAGFDTPIFDYSDHGGIPGWPTITWQRISMGLLRGLRFSDNLLALARKPQRAGRAF